MLPEINTLSAVVAPSMFNIIVVILVYTYLGENHCLGMPYYYLFLEMCVISASDYEPGNNFLFS